MQWDADFRAGMLATPAPTWGQPPRLSGGARLRSFLRWPTETLSSCARLNSWGRLPPRRLEWD